MQQFRTFWHVLRHSLIPFDYYYHKLRRTQFNFSVRYFLALCVGIVIFTATAQMSAFVTVFPKHRLQSLLASLALDYPEDLIITINSQGKLTTNGDMPYILFSPLTANPVPLLVVDPRAHEDKIEAFDSPILMTENHIYVTVANQQFIYDYEIQDPMRFTHSEFQSLIADLSQKLDYYALSIVLIYCVMIVVGTLAVILSHSILALLLTVITWIFYAILFRTHRAHKMIPPLKIVQIALHTMTAPLFLMSIFLLTPLTSSLPYWYVSMNILLLIGGVYEAYFAHKEHIS